MKVRTGAGGASSGNGGHRTPKDHPRVPVDEVLSCLSADHPGRGLDAFPERRSPAGEIVGVGGEHLEDIELEQLKRTPLRGPAEMPQQGTGCNLQETAHLDEWLDLREIPNHVLVTLRMGNQRPDTVLQQPLDELLRPGTDVAVRKLQKDD